MCSLVHAVGDSISLLRYLLAMRDLVVVPVYFAARLQYSRISSTFGFETAVHNSFKYKKNPIFLMESNIFSIITQSPPQTHVFHSKLILQQFQHKRHL